MTKEEIVRLAKEAGISKPWDQEPVKWETLERFAALVIAAERQRKAWDAKYWTAYEQDVAEAEREACAALCFQMWNKWLDSEDRSEFTRPDAEDCAAAIRARRQV
jgi:hypothetical protein